VASNVLDLLKRPGGVTAKELIERHRLAATFVVSHYRRLFCGYSFPL
jgi:hypothetical protein